MIVPSARLLLIAGAVVVPCATLAGTMPESAAVWIGAIAVVFVAAAVDAIFGFRRIDAIGVTAPDLIRLTKDVQAEVPLTFENANPVPLTVRVGITVPSSIVSAEIIETIALPPGQSVFAWQCTGVERGDHVLSAVHVEVPSPANLWAARASLPVQCHLRVYPNLRDKATAAVFQRKADLGARLQRLVGKGREFEKLREYLPGDSFEDIHWKATAKRRFPAVKLYQVEHSQEIYVIVDASRLAARENIMERYVEAALHLALVAERQNDRFGLITFSDRPHKFVPARNGMAHFRACREAIYNLQARRVSPDFRELFTSIATHLRRRSLLVFFTCLDDALLAETFDREIGVLSRRHVVLVNSMQTAGVEPLFANAPSSDADEIYDALAGQMLWNKMRQVQIELQSRGVRLSMVTPDQIKQQVTAAYLDVKRRQLL